MKLTKQQISELTDTQLSRAMIWLYVTRWTYIYKDDFDLITAGLRRSEGWMTSYLEDWDKLMPLVVENELEHEWLSTGKHQDINIFNLTSQLTNTVGTLQRAYCEALVYLKVGA